MAELTTVHPVSECGQPPGPPEAGKVAWPRPHPEGDSAYSWNRPYWYYRTCEWCALGMHAQRSDARFCSTRCRVAHHRASQ